MAPDDITYAWRVLSVTGLGMTVCFLNTSMLPVALPDMVADLEVGSLTSSWFLLAFQLVLAVLMLPMGRVSDTVGRRSMYIGGLAIVGLSAAVITLTSSPELIIAFRALQGLGAAAVIVNTTALLVDAFPPSKAAIGIGWNITIMSAAIALGPVIGGVLTEIWGWRGIFAVTIPLAVAGSVWSARTLRKGWDRPPGLLRHFDLLGTATSALGIGGLVLGVSMAGRSGWGDPLVLTCMAALVIGIALFIVVESRVARPILDFALLRLRFRACAYGSTALLNIGQSSIALIISLYLQSAAGLSAVDAGLHLTALAAGNVATAGIAGRLAVRWETRVLTTAGGSLALASLFGLAGVLAAGESGALLVALLFTLGVGNGLFVTPNAAAINVGVEPHQRGMANGFRVAIDQSALLVSSALALVLLTAGLPTAVKADAIGGRVERLSDGELARFVDAFPLTLLVICGWVAIALVISAMRGKTPALGLAPSPARGQG